MDMSGEDACDKAKKNGLNKEFKQFKNCSVKKKIIPMLPNGTHPNYNELPYFKYQLEERNN